MHAFQVMLHEDFGELPDILFNYNDAVNNNKLVVEVFHIVISWIYF